MTSNAPGFWSSPISASLLTQNASKLACPTWQAGALHWLQSLPEEGGRSAVMALIDGLATERTPANFSAKSSVHEYGGLCYCADDTTLYAVSKQDQQIYRIQDRAAARLTDTEMRFADLQLSPCRTAIYAVAEQPIQSQDEGEHEPIASIVKIDTVGGGVTTLAIGASFYASPAISACGSKLVFISWQHPNMPWNCNQLQVLHLATDELTDVSASEHCSHFQPQWHSNGSLVASIDLDEWYNLYQYQDDSWQPLVTMPAEIGLPQWVFGMSTWGFVGDNSLAFSANQGGFWKLYRYAIDTQTLEQISTEMIDIEACVVSPQGIALLGASNTSPSQLCVIGHKQPVAVSSSVKLDSNMVATAQPFSFKSGNAQAHGLYYAPTNANYQLSQAPPLIIMAHGGPTDCTGPGVQIKIQFYTSRGFAVADINYRGSTGYGRTYRHALDGNWGIYDVEDVCAAVKHLQDEGLASLDHTFIRGGSAGGYTVLAALAFTDVFKGGCSQYGIGELTALARDTHKFEARYLDSLLAPWPAGEQIYKDRSPLNHADQLSCPVLFLQGLDDKVVPPNQSRTMYEALVAKGVYTELKEYANEGHGFTMADTILDAFATELAFYQRLLQT